MPGRHVNNQQVRLYMRLRTTRLFASERKAQLTRQAVNYLLAQASIRAGLPQVPGLKPAILKMLRELPDRTGVGATTRRTLGLVEGHDEGVVWQLNAEERCFSSFMRRLLQSGERCPLSYFEIGEALCELAAAPVPALSGVTEHHFGMAMHDDAERFRRFQASPISRTNLGRSIVGGRDDWARYNPILRWWGGT